MSESLVGFAAASTRQNAGSVSVVCEPGGVKGPAATAVADRIVTLGIVSAARLAHAVPFEAAGAVVSASSGNVAAMKATTRRRVIGFSWDADYRSAGSRGSRG